MEKMRMFAAELLCTSVLCSCAFTAKDLGSDYKNRTYHSEVTANVIAEEDNSYISLGLLAGEPGDKRIIGDSENPVLICECLSEEDFEKAVNTDSRVIARGHQHEFADRDTDLGCFNTSPMMPYAKIYIRNDNTTDALSFSWTEGSPTGNVLAVGNVSAGNCWAFYKSEPLTSATYYVSFTSSRSNLRGYSLSRVASSITDLDI